MIKVGHYIPCYRHPVPELLAQVANESRVLTAAGVDYHQSSDEIGHITIARNRAMRAAMAAGCDYLVMQDSDVFCPSEDGAIMRMLQTASAQKATAVAAICGLRQDPPRPSVEPAHMGKIYKAHRAGAGLLLIDLHRVRDWGLDGGWFVDTYSSNGMDKECGQDIHFSRLIEKHGGDLWVDGRIPTAHSQRDSKSLFYPGADATASGQERDRETAT